MKDLMEYTYLGNLVTDIDEYYRNFLNGNFLVSITSETKNKFLKVSTPSIDECNEKLYAFSLLVVNSDNTTFKQKSDAAAFINLLIDRNFIPAFNLKGTSLENGILDDENQAKAIEYYEYAHDNGYKLGTYNLGRCYYQGRGVEYNPTKGLVLIEEAAMVGIGAAIKIIADQYRDGFFGYPQDYEKAAQLYEIAASKGRKSAMRELARLYLFGYGVEEDFSMYCDWMKISDLFSN